MARPPRRAGDRRGPGAAIFSFRGAAATETLDGRDLACGESVGIFT